MIRALTTFMLFAVCATGTLAQAAAGSVSHFEHSYDRFLRDIPLTEACITPTEIRSIKPIRTCVQLEPVDQTVIVDRPNLSPTWTCRKFANVKLVYPREIQSAYCAQYTKSGTELQLATGECGDVVYRRETLPEKIEVREVRTDAGGTKVDYIPASFSFPGCE